MRQIEALKTREGAQQMIGALRALSPELASAVIDERDEVSYVMSCLKTQ